MTSKELTKICLNCNSLADLPDETAWNDQYETEAAHSHPTVLSMYLLERGMNTSR